MRKHKHRISKLPMRQLTLHFRVATCSEFSKLPMRQLTFWEGEEPNANVSKLPMRQLTMVDKLSN